MTYTNQEKVLQEFGTVKEAGFNGKGIRLYGVFGKDSNSLYLVTPDQTTAEKMLGTKAE